MTPIILVAGTHGLRDVHALDDVTATPRPWWHPRSAFGVELLTHGLALVDDKEPFLWSTDIDGLMAKNLGWYAGGAALRYFAHAKHPPLAPGVWRPIAVIAHSHGGQVALHAAAQGLMIETLITLGTPVRADMVAIAAAAQPRIGTWIHVYSDVDGWQAAGELGDGYFGLRRTFPLALNILEAGAAHEELHDPQRWTARRWWSSFFQRGAA